MPGCIQEEERIKVTCCQNGWWWDGNQAGLDRITSLVPLEPGYDAVSANECAVRFDWINYVFLGVTAQNSGSHRHNWCNMNDHHAHVAWDGLNQLFEFPSVADGQKSTIHGW